MGVWFYSPGQGHLHLSKCEDLDELDVAHLPPALSHKLVVMIDGAQVSAKMIPFIF